MPLFPEDPLSTYNLVLSDTTGVQKHLPTDKNACAFNVPRCVPLYAARSSMLNASSMAHHQNTSIRQKINGKLTTASYRFLASIRSSHVVAIHIPHIRIKICVFASCGAIINSKVTGCTQPVNFPTPLFPCYAGVAKSYLPGSLVHRSVWFCLVHLLSN